MFDSFGIWGQARHTDGGQAPHSATTTADKRRAGPPEKRRASLEL